MTFAADVKAQNVVVVPESLVIFLFCRVEQQVNLGGREVVGAIVGRVGLWTPHSLNQFLDISHYVASVQM